MAGNVKLMTSAGGGVVLDTATTTATDVTVKVPVTGVNNGTLVCSDSSGNVGIGTSSPAAPLSFGSYVANNNQTVHVYANGNAKHGFGTAAGAFRSFYASDANYVIGSLSTSDGTTFTERMRIDSSGNLLVGTTTGPAGITQGIVHAKSGASTNTYSATLTTAGYTAYGVSSPTSGNAMYMWNTSTSAAVGAIVVNSSSTSYNTTSDYRLKENIQPMQNALGVVAQLNPVTYNWKADGSDGQGFIAHELQAVVPDCVTGEKDAVDEEGNPVYQGIDTSFLSATLTKAIQELKAMVDAQAAEIAELKAKLA